MSSDNAWAQLVMREVHIVTPRGMGGEGTLYVRGEVLHDPYLVMGVDEHSGKASCIAVRSMEALRELVPALHPASITYQCSDDERPAMRALVEALQQDRRIVETRQ